MEYQRQYENAQETPKIEKDRVNINNVVLEAVQQLKNQYIDMFQKAKIYEVKNIIKLANRIQANSNGYI